MQIFCVYSKKQLGKVSPVYYDYVIAGLARAGAQACDEFEFAAMCQQGAVSRDAKVIVFFLEENMFQAVIAPILPQNRFAYLVDTKINDDGTLAYDKRIQQFRRLNVHHALITYPIARDTKILNDAGIHTVVMPCCVSMRRPRINKYNGIVMTGTYDDRFYPTRTRLGRLFRIALPGVAGVAVPKGTHGTGPIDQRAAPSLVGEAYHEMLDGCQMAVVCRAGVRDYMVAKYVEFGMSHVLPVGDCPSHMPDDMKRLMVNVEGMSDEDIIHEVKRLLASPDELQARQEKYCDLVHGRYDLLTNAHRVIAEIERS
jgi:hypothetical protein